MFLPLYFTLKTVYLAFLLSFFFNTTSPVLIYNYCFLLTYCIGHTLDLKSHNTTTPHYMLNPQHYTLTIHSKDAKFHETQNLHETWNMKAMELDLCHKKQTKLPKCQRKIGIWENIKLISKNVKLAIEYLSKVQNIHLLLF